MKKTYVKPCITVEYFTLSQSIASSCTCTGVTNHGAPSSCHWQLASGDLIWTSAPNCDDQYNEDFEFGGICYNAPSGSQSIFAS